MAKELVSLKITLERPPGVYMEDLKRYIEDAVASWKGQFHPEEPLRHLNGDSVKVVSLRRAK